MKIPDGIYIHGIILKLVNPTKLRDTFCFIKRESEIFKNPTILENLYIKDWNELYKKVGDKKLCDLVKEIIKSIKLKANVYGKQLSGGQKKLYIC